MSLHAHHTRIFDLDDAEPWRAHAACIGINPAAFFMPVGLNDTVLPAVEALCDACPVSEPCLEHAIVWDEQGVWAGTTEADRRRIRRSAPGRYRRRRRPYTNTNTDRSYEDPGQTAEQEA